MFHSWHYFSGYYPPGGILTANTHNPPSTVYLCEFYTRFTHTCIGNIYTPQPCIPKRSPAKLYTNELICTPATVLEMDGVLLITRLTLRYTYIRILTQRKLWMQTQLMLIRKPKFLLKKKRFVKWIFEWKLKQKEIITSAILYEK